MDSKKRSTKAATIVTGLIVGGVALATLTTTGCGTDSVEQASALITRPAGNANDQPGDSSKLDLLSRLAGNHNETFLISAP